MNTQNKKIILTIFSILFFANFVSASININGIENYSSLQDAINNASNGDVINIGAGIYNENQIIINKSLTINGEGKGITIIKPISDTGTSGDSRGWIVVDSGTVSFNEITFDGSGYKIYQAIRHKGNGTINSCEFKNILYEPSSYYQGVGIAAMGSGVLNVYDSNFENIGRIGVIFFGENVEGIFKGNSYTGKGNGDWLDYGVEVGNGAKITIINNTITNNKGIADSDGSTSSGILITTYFGNGTNVELYNNTISNSNTAVSVGYDSNDESIVKANFNEFLNNNLSIVNTGIKTVNGENNYYGNCEPDPNKITGNVDYTPWIGVCVEEKTHAPSCITFSDDVSLYANVSSDYCIGNVVFSVLKNNVWNNFTGINDGTKKYFYDLDSSFISSGEIFNWTVYVYDCKGHISNSSINNFYVNKQTKLTTTPSLPDGINGWYVSQPTFELENADASSISYRWDSTTIHTYSSLFGLEDAPNNANMSGGIHKLSYWSVLSCGKTESEIETILKFDFTDPLVINTIPLNNSVLFLEPKPLIQARIDEIYQSNSGVNLTRINMSLDNVDISNNIVISKVGNDAIVKFEPEENLIEGNHIVKITAYDNSGRMKEEQWEFFINMSTPEFDLTINNPLKDSYGTKKVQLNITTTRYVDEILIINLNDNRPKFSKLCANCNEYGLTRKKTKTMNEGNNTIIIRAIDEYGKIKEINRTFFVDSKTPKISNILPKKNQIINGSEFYVKYNEDFLDTITLFFDENNETLENCESGNKKECKKSLNLNSFNDMFIDFYFEVSDILHKTRSKETRVFVDTISPSLNVTLPIENETYYGKKVPFNITSSEKVTIEYYDLQDSRPKWKRLCTNCNEYGNEKIKIKSFKPGIHNILITAIDKAGNADTKEIRFYVA